MKKFKFTVVLAAVLCALMITASVALAGSFTDMKYYQDQSASWGQGVIKSVSCESGIKRQTQTSLTMEGKDFGALNCVPCAGVLSVGQMDLSVTETDTTTRGTYLEIVKQVSLAGSVGMNQLGGLASASSGGFCFDFASSGGCLQQNQHLSLDACATLPGGYASHAYTGHQVATIGGGS